MRFDQAFYTWGEEQISRYRRGLGICASSNMETSFLDSCLNLGSDFNAENTQEQSEFLVYSDKFDRFVAVSVNPAPVASDGRKNKLCHFFIPQKKNAELEPEQYLMDYPFEKEKPQKIELETVEVEPLVYDYEECLKYFMDIDKLKELLYMVYRCLFREKKPLNIVIDPMLHEEKLSVIARKLVWAFHVWTPIAFRKSLTYGVNTTVNTNAINFCFTTSVLKDNFLYQMDEPCPFDMDEIPEFIHKLAEYAWNREDGKAVANKTRVFVQNVFAQELTGRMDWNNLQLMYWSWLMDQGEYLSEDKLKKRMSDILWMSEKSAWHASFMKKFLEQLPEEELTEMSALAYWKRCILPWVQRLETIEENNPMQNLERRDIYRIAGKLFAAIGKGSYYDASIKEIPSGARKNIIPALYDEVNEAKQTDVVKRFVGVTNSQLLKEYLTIYPEAVQSRKFRDDLYKKGRALYERADRIERDCLSKIIDRQIVWLDVLKNEVLQITYVDTLLEILDEELDQIEDALISVYYEKLLSFARYEDDYSVRLRIKEAEQKMSETRKADINIENKNEFQGLFKEWKRDLEAQEIRQSNIWDLLKMDWMFIRNHKELWVDRVNTLILEQPFFSYELFNELSKKYKEVYKAAGNTDLLEHYERGILRYIEKTDNLLDRLQLRIQLQIQIVNNRNTNEYNKNIDFWHQLDGVSISTFRNIYEYKKNNRDYSNLASDYTDFYRHATPKANGIRKCYLIWEKVIEKRMRLEEREFMELLRSKSKEYLSIEFVEALCDLVTEEEGMYAVYNFCVLINVREKILEIHSSKDWENRWLLQFLRQCKAVRTSFLARVMSTGGINNMSIEAAFKKIKAYCVIAHAEELTRDNLMKYAIYGELAEQIYGMTEELQQFRAIGGRIVNELRDTINQDGKTKEELFRAMQSAYQTYLAAYETYKQLEVKMTHDRRSYDEISYVDQKNHLGTKTAWYQADRDLELFQTNETMKMKRELDMREQEMNRRNQEPANVSRTGEYGHNDIYVRETQEGSGIRETNYYGNREMVNDRPSSSGTAKKIKRKY